MGTTFKHDSDPSDDGVARANLGGCEVEVKTKVQTSGRSVRSFSAAKRWKETLDGLIAELPAFRADLLVKQSG
ncbi:diguanylate cyclase/phosphodiesterase [Anopheles sinensis]|uniref:Diguanylate cyclase/phosphodiesterase n=1 Tax=Anopheles sinensis TaxID=74873 RepID=A0A084VTE6_ANOSI|nr:diguanylate cyclase/phosphodiesterase [Anopheles sinensis]